MYIKQLEIDNFKSFANKAAIPLLEGFTTVSGPNGSGKSNIIDSIMFALGLRTGSALRIENLSDFITTFNNRNEAYGHGAADPHHVTDDSKGKKGDCVVLDIGGFKDGYASDMTRTVFLGEVSERQNKALQVHIT